MTHYMTGTLLSAFHWSICSIWIATAQDRYYYYPHLHMRKLKHRMCWVTWLGFTAMSGPVRGRARSMTLKIILVPCHCSTFAESPILAILAFTFAWWPVKLEARLHFTVLPRNHKSNENHLSQGYLSANVWFKREHSLLVFVSWYVWLIQMLFAWKKVGKVPKSTLFNVSIFFSLSRTWHLSGSLSLSESYIAHHPAVFS